MTPSLTRYNDDIWTQKPVPSEPETFIDRCKRICQGTRFRVNVFNKLPPGMEDWPGWKEVSENFSEHLPEFHGTLEYVVRRIFKALFNSEGNLMFQWFIERCVMAMTVTSVLVGAMKRCKKGSRERRTLQAVLHSNNEQFMMGTESADKTPVQRTVTNANADHEPEDENTNRRSDRAAETE